MKPEAAPELPTVSQEDDYENIGPDQEHVKKEVEEGKCNSKGQYFK